MSAIIEAAHIVRLFPKNKAILDIRSCFVLEGGLVHTPLTTTIVNEDGVLIVNQIGRMSFVTEGVIHRGKAYLTNLHGGGRVIFTEGAEFTTISKEGRITNFVVTPDGFELIRRPGNNQKYPECTIFDTEGVAIRAARD